MRQLLWTVVVLAGFAFGMPSAQAGPVEIVDAKARASGSGVYSFDVTLKHGDTGWKHYVNAWDVTTPDGKVLGTRKLLHPHVDEQPFTRSLGSVKIPEGITHVIIRAYDKVHGLSDKTFELALPDRD